MIRKIVNINKDLCNGCGICLKACHEAAIVLKDGKAELLKDIYCDGLGDCLSGCPTGAITIIEREADGYDEEAVERRVSTLKQSLSLNNAGLGKIASCDSSFILERKNNGCSGSLSKEIKNNHKASDLMQWPVQLQLINSRAPFLKDSELLITAQCSAYAYKNFHEDFMKDKITIIACPKLSDNEYNKNKLYELLKDNNIRSIKVIRMEVPCCGGLTGGVKEAMKRVNYSIDYEEITINSQGEII